MWSPYQITVLLHHHTSAAEFPRSNAPVYGEVISGFIEMGLLHRNPEGFLTTTERAHALIDMWRSTPLPEMRWVDPRLDDKGGA